MTLKTQILIGLVAIGFIDTIIPLPITALVLVYVLFQKPAWFRRGVDDIYRD
jgi:hypothetical protein